MIILVNCTSTRSTDDLLISPFMGTNLLSEQSNCAYLSRLAVLRVYMGFQVNKPMIVNSALTSSVIPVHDLHNDISKKTVCNIKTYQLFCVFLRVCKFIITLLPTNYV